MDWMNGIHEKLEAYTETFVKAMELHLNNQLSVDNSDTEKSDSQDTFGCWRILDDVEDESMESDWKTEWETYLRASRLKDYHDFSVRIYWLENQVKFPILSRVALDLLSVPSMSIKVERIFSGYGDTM